MVILVQENHHWTIYSFGRVAIKNNDRISVFPRHIAAVETTNILLRSGPSRPRDLVKESSPSIIHADFACWNWCGIRWKLRLQGIRKSCFLFFFFVFCFFFCFFVFLRFPQRRRRLKQSRWMTAEFIAKLPFRSSELLEVCVNLKSTWYFSEMRAHTMQHLFFHLQCGQNNRTQAID